jgi:hypothetical protein
MSLAPQVEVSVDSTTLPTTPATPEGILPVCSLGLRLLVDQVRLLGGGRREERVGAVLDGGEDGARVEADEGRSSIITGQIEDYEVLS